MVVESKIYAHHITPEKYLCCSMHCECTLLRRFPVPLLFVFVFKVMGNGIAIDLPRATLAQLTLGIRLNI